MFDWWNELTTFEHILYYIAVPFTIVLCLQTILTFLGMDDQGDMDMESEMPDDFEGEFDGDFEISFQMFTVRNFIAFFTFFGWGGIWAASTGKTEFIAGLIAIGFGGIAMALSASFFYFMKKMAQSGNLVIQYAVGKSGDVYLRIPPEREGTGKINLVVQGALRELEAITDDKELIKTGSQVEVVSILNASTVVVTKVH